MYDPNLNGLREIILSLSKSEWRRKNCCGPSNIWSPFIETHWFAFKIACLGCKNYHVCTMLTVTQLMEAQHLGAVTVCWRKNCFHLCIYVYLEVSLPVVEYYTLAAATCLIMSCWNNKFPFISQQFHVSTVQVHFSVTCNCIAAAESSRSCG